MMKSKTSKVAVKPPVVNTPGALLSATALIDLVTQKVVMWKNSSFEVIN